MTCPQFITVLRIILAKFGLVLEESSKVCYISFYQNSLRKIAIYKVYSRKKDNEYIKYIYTVASHIASEVSHIINVRIRLLHWLYRRSSKTDRAYNFTWQQRLHLLQTLSPSPSSSPSGPYRTSQSPLHLKM